MLRAHRLGGMVGFPGLVRVSYTSKEPYDSHCPVVSALLSLPHPS